ncbi:MAG: HD-GYP domain-containing protein [Holdemania massiliensis]
MMLIVIIDFRSRHTVTHTMITASTAVQLGQRCGLQDAELMMLKIAGLFHDLGKIGIPLEILENPGRLSAEEMAIMKTHVEKPR